MTALLRRLAIPAALGLLVLVPGVPPAGASAEPSPTAPTAGAPPADGTGTTTPSATASPSTSSDTGSITGQLTEADTGKPIAFSAVWIDGVGDTLTSKTGHYTLTAHAGTYRLQAGLGGIMDVEGGLYPYLNRRADGTTPQTKAPTVTVVSGATSTVNMTLTRAGHVSGTVLNASGQPVRNAWLSARVQRTSTSHLLGVRMADANGKFSFYVNSVTVPTRVAVFVYTVKNGREVLAWRSHTFVLAPQSVVAGIRAVPLAPTASSSPAPTATPTGGLPQTGGSGWVLVLAAAGLMLLIMGGAMVTQAHGRRGQRTEPTGDPRN